METDLQINCLVRPLGPIHARWIGEVGSSGMVLIRYWKVDPATARNSPVEVVARFCSQHCIFYLKDDYPGGCPECNKP